MIHSYRITQRKHRFTAFDGEGAEVNGGRWNSVGTKIVYTSSSLSLATLEILVHVEDYSMIYNQYIAIPVEFDESLVKDIEPSSLPKSWDSPQVNAQTQIIGDKWISSMSSLILEVPSVVTKSETNFLINPQHPDVTKLVIGQPFNFDLDTRLQLDN